MFDNNLNECRFGFYFSEILDRVIVLLLFDISFMIL